MTPHENDPVTDVPTIEIQSHTDTLDWNDIIGGNEIYDPMADLAISDSPAVYDPVDEFTTSNADSAPGTVPTANQEEVPDLVGLGKDLLSAYADRQDAPPDYDPQNHPFRFLWYDAPELILAGLIAGYIGYKGTQGVADLLASASSESSTPQQPTPPLENRPYRVFVSHSWKYSDQRERVEEFLGDEDRLQWQNFSVPEDDPLDVENANDLRQQLYNQIQQANAVIVIAGMYVPHSTWIEEEIEMAVALEKPIIGVKLWGKERLPKLVREEADEIVGWQQRSIVNAIARHG